MNQTLDKYLKITTISKENKNIGFPKKINLIKVPPIKCQGIKSKLVNFILENIEWDGNGTWFEPFLGSGVVSFNAAPEHAILSDINPHLINFYSAIQKNKITPKIAKDFLEEHGNKLKTTDASKNSYYYEMRAKFNETKDPLYLLFLNRSCFNGLIRFNDKGLFNTPFGRKPGRFAPAYITKIVNQIAWVQKIIYENEYKFECSSWKDVLKKAKENDFAYIDPPYFGRHTTYYENWIENDALELLAWSKTAGCGYAISLWYKNKYRENPMVTDYANHCVIRYNAHYYFLGSFEENRHKMEEALILKPNFATTLEPKSRETFRDYNDD